MAQPPFVLKALQILGLEEMLKLSKVLQVKQVPLKKAAGEDLVVWDGPDAKPAEKQRPEARILEFPKDRSFSEAPASVPATDPLEAEGPSETAGEGTAFCSSEMLLMQREISKDAESLLIKKDAVNGYKKVSEMYVVKSQDLDGKDKIRFASTHGVLVDKKQA